MEEVLNYIFRRRSSRKFLDKPIEPEKLELLVKAGMAAPSAMNGQPWEFVIITDPARLESLRTILPYGKFFASAAIAVCGAPLSHGNPTSEMFWVQDCSAATENILLASYELGLGACWIGIHPVPVLKQVVHKFLGLPRSVKPLSIIYLGYPEFFKDPRTQYDPTKVHWQKYGQKQ
jgi:nitroreductase